MLASPLSQRLSFHYGWVVAALSALILFAAFGIRLSFSVFFVLFIDEFGWSRADTSIIFSTTMIVFALTSTGAGFVFDRWGAKRTFSLGCLILGIGLFLSSQINSLFALTITYGIIGGLGITILGLSMHGSLIGIWFQDRRGLAIGVAFCGTGLGSLIVIPAVEALAAQLSWRASMQALGFLVLLLIPIILLFLADRPAHLKQDSAADQQTISSSTANGFPTGWTFAQVIRAPSFWLVLLAGLCNIGPVRMLTVHQLALLREGGLSTAGGARLIALAGLVTTCTFVLSGILADRIGRTATYAIGGACLIIALGLMGSVDQIGQTWLIWVYPIVLGLGEGSRSSLISVVVADLFAGKTLGAINGTVGGMFGIGAAFLPWLAGYVFDETGSYQQALWVGMGAVCVAVCALYLAVTVHRDVR